MINENKKTISTVLQEQTDFLLSIEGVFGVSEGKAENGSVSILLQVEKLTDEINRKIPKIIDGYQVTIMVTDQPSSFDS